MLRTCLLSAVVVAAVASVPAVASSAPSEADAAASPSGSSRVGASTPTPADLAVTRTRSVHLITGDTVRVLTLSDGSTRSSVVAGPHLGSPAARWGTATESYLMPRTSSSERSKLDLSLFDVSRLARLPGSRTPVVVTFRSGAATPALLAVARALHATASTSPTARSGRAATRVLHGWYADGSAGLGPSALRGVRSVRLDVAPEVAPPVTGPTHALTTRVVQQGGRPAEGVVVLVENVDDADVYLESVDTDETGSVTVDVPDGDYSVLAWDFDRLVVDADVAVTADTTVPLDLTTATVRPHVSLPGFRQAEAVLSVSRTPATGFTFPLVFSGSHFYLRVQPTSAQVRHGSLHTGVTAKLTPVGGGRAQHARRIAVTADLSDGIPADLTYRHRRADFARVVQRFYANGPAGPRQTYVEAEGPDLDLFTGHEYDATVPGRRTLLLQASPTAYYQQTVLPQAPPDSDNLTQLITVDHFPVAGRTYVVPFAHGPVGPGAEGHDGVGRVTREDDHLSGYLSLFSGAGRSMDGYVSGTDGRWSLSQDDEVVQRGRHELGLDVVLPPERHTYTLRAVSRPTSDLWDLSTRVADVWTFHSRHGAGHPALVMPSYLPPSSMSGYVAPGRTHFALRFAAAGLPRISRAGAEISSDGGRHWTLTRLTRTGASSFRVGYRNPAARTPGAKMSIRVTGRDPQGDRVEETAIDVYRLR